LPVPTTLAGTHHPHRRPPPSPVPITLTGAHHPRQYLPLLPVLTTSPVPTTLASTHHPRRYLPPLPVLHLCPIQPPSTSFHHFQAQNHPPARANARWRCFIQPYLPSLSGHLGPQPPDPPATPSVRETRFVLSPSPHPHASSAPPAPPNVCWGGFRPQSHPRTRATVCSGSSSKFPLLISIFRCN
jgi:hypothetical protein